MERFWRMAPLLAVVVFVVTAVVAYGLSFDEHVHETTIEAVFAVGVLAAEILLYSWKVVRGGRWPLCARDHQAGAARWSCRANHGVEWRWMVGLALASLVLPVGMAMAGEPLGGLMMTWLPMGLLAVGFGYRVPKDQAAQ